LWYRSDHLEEEGFRSPPSSFEELREVATATVRREGDQITREGFDTNLGGGPDWQAEMQTYWDFMHPAGGRFLSDDLSRCTLDEEPAVDALEFLATLVLQDKVMPYPSFENQGELSALELGLATMGTSVEIPDIRARQYAPEQVEFIHAALPLTREVQAAHLYVNKYFIGSQTQDPEGSWLLLQHLTAPENLEAYSAAGGYLTPRSSLAEADYLSDNLKTVAKAGEYGVPYPRHPNLLELFRPFSENLDRCFRGQLTPLETMQETVNAVNALL
jgi:multiple sugar transport system substrate-binding protein